MTVRLQSESLSTIVGTRNFFSGLLEALCDRPEMTFGGNAGEVTE
jgi:hypothetical protein